MPITGSIDVEPLIANLGLESVRATLRPAAPAPLEAPSEDIYRASYGADEISTCTELAVPVIIRWDVNEYYRSLGIEWPYDPSRKELRLGYQDRGGPDSDRLTYYFKQLLDPVVREEYDQSKLGTRYFDRYEAEKSVRNMSGVAGKISGEEGKVVTVDDLLKDQPPEQTQELPQLSGEIFYAGYYLFKSRKWQTQDLALWLDHLVRAHSDAGIRRQISIGYTGEPGPFLIKQWRGKLIFFLNENESSSLELAETAVSKSLLLNRKELNDHSNSTDSPASRR